MSPKHAGESRIADQALMDRVRACTEEMGRFMLRPVPVSLTEAERARDRSFINQWAGRAYALLAEIGDVGE